MQRFMALLLVLMLLIYPAARISAQSSGVQAAWERAQQAGSYDFGADITQTTLPLPTVTNIGRTSLQEKIGETVEHELISLVYE